MPVTVNYSHAAPFIREQFVRAHSRAENARTIRERRAEFAAAHAYGTALRIMAESGDTTPTPGIADLRNLGGAAVTKAAAWLGPNADVILGPPDTWEGEPLRQDVVVGA